MSLCGDACKGRENTCSGTEHRARWPDIDTKLESEFLCVQTSDRVTGWHSINGYNACSATDGHLIKVELLLIVRATVGHKT